MQPFTKADLDTYVPGTIDKLTPVDLSARTSSELLRRDLYWIFEAYHDVFLVGSLAYAPIINPVAPLEALDCDLITISRDTQNKIDWGLKARGFKHNFNKLGGHRYTRNNSKIDQVDLWHEPSLEALEAKVRDFPKGCGFVWRPYQTIYFEPTRWANYPKSF